MTKTFADFTLRGGIMIIPARSRRVHYEAVPDDLAAAFTFRDFDWPAFPFNWHYHPEVELTLILRGRGKRFVGDSVEDFSDGDLCLIGSDTPHCWVSGPDTGRVRSLVIQFRPESWGQAFWHLPELRGIRTLLTRAKRGLEVRGAAQRDVKQLFTVLEQQPPGSMPRFGTLLEMLHCIAQADELKQLSHSAGEPCQGSESNAKLGQILSYIHEHLGPELTQHEVAHAVHLSPAGFSQFFRRSLGTSYVAYVNDLKIRNACRALLDTDKPITEIAFHAGFNNLSHFNVQFQRFRHVSPRAFRMQARKTESNEALPSKLPVSGAGRDVTVHGKGTHFEGVRVGTEEPRPWLKGYAVCPALRRFNILHTGVAEIQGQYQILRTHQTTSYFLACCAGRGRVLVAGRWRIIGPGLACLLPAHAYNAFEVLPGETWRFAYVCYGQSIREQPRLPLSLPAIGEFEPEPLRIAIQGLAAECRTRRRPAHVDRWLELVQDYVCTFTAHTGPAR